LKATSLHAEKRIERLHKEDYELLGYVKYLSQKYKELTHEKKFLYKDIAKKYKDNELWRGQFH
jgi:hypothetical protein